MDSNELYELLRRCQPAQLTRMTRLLRLDSSFISENAGTAERANDIMSLVEQRGLLPDLEKLLLETFPAAAQAALAQQKCIVFIAANPVNTEDLQTDRERELIAKRLREADGGKTYRIESVRSAKLTDLSLALQKHKPVIVHFSGHGSPSAELLFEDQYGGPAPVDPGRLAELFDLVQGQTECVVLNACFSYAQAELLSRRVGCVVGMERAIGDADALQFSTGFYRALAFGKDYRTAYGLGCVEIDLAQLPDAVVPRYVTRAGEQIAAPRRAATGARVERGKKKKAEHEGPAAYPVWYGTNRRPRDPNHPEKGFLNERNPDEARLYLGECEVVIPKSHRFTAVGSSWWERFKSGVDDRLSIKRILPLADDEFWTSLRERVQQGHANRRDSLVFIHGFNVSFEEAAIRAAQLGCDLKIPGATAFYSWPSRHRMDPLGYAADEAAISACATKICQFLLAFAQNSGSDRVHVLAHSMGNRGLLQALVQMLPLIQGGARPFTHLIFAAPDEDAETFRDRAVLYPGAASRATLYVSARDLAVKSSSLLHGAARAGFTPPVTRVEGIDTINVANVDLSLLGHGYYGAAEGVLYDLRELLIHDTPPDDRIRLAKADGDGARNPYWTIGA